MKYKTIIAVGTWLAWSAAARADLPSTVTTTDGQTYNNVTLIRADPDGYLVNYAPVKNGVGIAKIKFSRLSDDLQKQAGYVPAKARDFEARVADDNEKWRQEAVQWEQAAKAAKQAAQAREDIEQQMETARLTAMAQLEQAEAHGGAGEGGYYGVPYGNYGGYGTYGHGYLEHGGAFADWNRSHTGENHGEPKIFQFPHAPHNSWFPGQNPFPKTVAGSSVRH